MNLQHRPMRFIEILPTLTAAVGIAAVQGFSGSRWAIGSEASVALLVTIVAPLAAAILLRRVSPGSDLLLISVAGMLVAIGSVTLIALSGEAGAVGEFYGAIAFRHGLFAGVGYLALLAGVLAATRVDKVIKYPFTILGIAITLTLATVVFGSTVNGARLWLQIGAVRFQPSEVARVLIAIFVSIYLYDRRHLIAAPWRVGSMDLVFLPYLLPLLAALSGAAAVLVLQNDLGMAALVLLGGFASMVAVFTSRATLGFAIALLGLATIGAYVTVERVRDRVAGWLNPWDDPAGRGFQFVQADYGFAAGGVFGGGSSLVGANVPEIHTDLILVGVGNQFGWLTAVGLVSMLSLLVCRCALASLRARNRFEVMLGLSLTGVIAIQSILIVGGTLRVLPLTGLTVPLASYGGSSITVTLFTIGVIAGLRASPRRTHRLLS